MRHHVRSERIGDAQAGLEPRVRGLIRRTRERDLLKVKAQPGIHHELAESQPVLGEHTTARGVSLIAAGHGQVGVGTQKRVAACVRRVVGRSKELIHLAAELQHVALADSEQVFRVYTNMVCPAGNVTGGCAGDLSSVISAAWILGRSKRMGWVPEKDAVRASIIGGGPK